MDFPKSVPNVGLVSGKFVDENTTTGQIGSLIPAVWGNAVTSEIINVIEEAELVVTEGENDQLVLAIRRLIANSAAGIATEEKAGVASVATQIETNQGVNNSKFITPLKLSRLPLVYAPGYLNGLQMSHRPGLSLATIEVGVGGARSSDNLVNINVTSAIAGVIQSAGVWSAGTGGNKLDIGTRAANLWYHVFVIQNIATGVGDFLISLNPTAPSLPAGYAGSRRVGSVKTDGNGGVTPFINVGRMFWWAAPIKDAAGSMASGSFSEVTLTLSIPTGVRVLCRVHAAFTGAATNLYFRSVDAPVISSSWLKTNSLASLGEWNGGLGMNTYEVDFGSWPFEVLTNSAAAVVMQYQNAPMASFFSVVTLGWTEF